MQFQSMDYFFAAARERSFTKAAEVLHITQQALSAQREQDKTERRASRRQARQERQAQAYEARQQKRKEKHRGH